MGLTDMENIQTVNVAFIAQEGFRHIPRLLSPPWFIFKFAISVVFFFKAVKMHSVNVRGLSVSLPYLEVLF